ncbi:SGNH hydrolase-type esterase domain-containing protein [Aspergillus pseudocaelatus]|uniref:SGNH hydrolase-type esterase domain-containing protein n=1 Tax=Aspergillus pseudocaelatus TaxID=1825620 RepID=A0ABQ6X2S1_9EURO|nr:SGNH hydrolase-type esterase domain-containing protein [Aspergillus pseudocaelatus]
MASRTWLALLLVALHASPSLGHAIPHILRDNKAGGLDDFSSIKKFAAIGDSYSAGIGAGEVLKGGAEDVSCSRYDQSYPSIMNRDVRMGGSAAHEFTYLSCSGDESPAIWEQAKKLDKDYDLITISAGGNDLGFSDIVQNCIYQVSIITETHCSDSLNHAQDVLQSQEFENNIHKLLKEAGKHLSSSGSIYYTGYGTFFNNETTACNNISWSVANFGKHHQYLTQELRTQMNDLVLSLNAMLDKLVTAAGYTFVDYENDSQGLLGRFCDEGVSEYHALNTETGLWKPRWYSMWFSNPFPPQTISDSDENKDRSLLPDIIAQWFHPRPITNYFIANKIFNKMSQAKAKKQGTKYPPFVNRPKDSCAASKSKHKTGDPLGVSTESPKCFSYKDSSSRSVLRDDILKGVEQFCKNVPSFNLPPGKDVSQQLPRLNSGGTSSNWIRYEVDEAETEEENVIRPMSEEICKKNFLKTIDGCGNNEADTATYGGSIKVGPVKLSWYPYGTGNIRMCRRDHMGASDTALPRGKFKEAIDSFCGTPFSAADVRTLMYAATGTTTPIGDQYIQMKVQPAENQSGCTRLSSLLHTPFGNECKKKFMSAVDSCDTDSMNEKHGAWGIEDDGDGCWEWIIRSQKDYDSPHWEDDTIDPTGWNTWKV